MKIKENLGSVFLSSWLIFYGVQNLLHRNIPVISDLLPLFAILAGIFILFSFTKFIKSTGLILLAVWLIMKGIWPYLPGTIPLYATVLNGLAIVAGIVILATRRS